MNSTSHYLRQENVRDWARDPNYHWIKKKNRLLAAILTHKEEFNRVSAAIVASLAFIISLRFLKSGTLRDFLINQTRRLVLKTLDDKLTDDDVSEILKIENIDKFFTFMQFDCETTLLKKNIFLLMFHPDKNSNKSPAIQTLMTNITQMMNNKVSLCKTKQVNESDATEESDKGHESDATEESEEGHESEAEESEEGHESDAEESDKDNESEDRLRGVRVVV